MTDLMGWNRTLPRAAESFQRLAPEPLDLSSSVRLFQLQPPTHIQDKPPHTHTPLSFGRWSDYLPPDFCFSSSSSCFCQSCVCDCQFENKDGLSPRLLPAFVFFAHRRIIFIVDCSLVNVTAERCSSSSCSGALELWHDKSPLRRSCLCSAFRDCGWQFMR